LLKEFPLTQIRDWVYQLVHQDLLEQTEDQYPTLKLNDLSWEVMRKQREVKLLRSRRRERTKTSQAASESWEGVDQGLAEHLRRWRMKIATERKLPPYTIFDDRTLRELCRVRPSTTAKMKFIPGMGEKRLQDHGATLLKLITEYSAENGLELDRTSTGEPAPEPRSKSINRTYFAHFQKGESISEVAKHRDLSMNTVRDHLCTFIEVERPQSIDAWVQPEIQNAVRQAVQKVGLDRLKPIFLELNETIPYDAIAIVVSFLRAGR
jgi:ATP-dependent DNA helicase RecQ